MYRLCPGRALVLASASPRRSEMLTRLGLEFRLAPAEVDESLLPDEDPVDAARRLAQAKARAVEPKAGEAVLAADTLVVLGHEIMGKPADTEEAAAMLGRLSGAEHQVLTGFCLRYNQSEYLGLGRTTVRFRPLSPEEIAAYVATGEPMDKAGAYAVQGRGAALVSQVRGSYTNVVGLPLAAVVELLLGQGIIQALGEES